MMIAHDRPLFDCFFATRWVFLKFTVDFKQHVCVGFRWVYDHIVA